MPSVPAKQQTGPVKAAQGPLTQVVNESQRLYNGGTGFTAPAGNFVSPFNRQQNTALNGLFNYGAAGNPLAGQSQGVLGSIMGGDIAHQYGDLMSGASNQAFEGALDTQAAHLTDDVNRQYSGLGRTGSVANAADVASQVGDVRNQALSNQWNQNIANQRGILGDSTNAALSAVGAAPGAWAQGLLPFAAEQQAGDARQQQQQRMLDQRRSNMLTNMQAPWNRLNAYSTTLGGPAAALGSVSSGTAGSNPIGGALGGALMGGQVGSMFGMPGVGAAVGGGAGLLANIFHV